MLKVVKFGGSSLADAAQFRKVKEIVLADPARRVVVVSAPGKRFDGDHKITDLLYLCYAHIQYGVSAEGVFGMIAERYRSDQPSLCIQHIADVDCLTVQPHLTDMLNRLIHRQIFLQGDILHRHDASGGILRVPEKVIDCLSGVGLRVCQYFIHNVRGHLFQKIHGIIRHQIIDYIRRFLIGKGINNHLLAVHLKVGKNIRRQILRENPVNLQQTLLIQLFHQCRNVRVVQLSQELA